MWSTFVTCRRNILLTYVLIFPWCSLIFLICYLSVTRPCCYKGQLVPLLFSGSKHLLPSQGLRDFVSIINPSFSNICKACLPPCYVLQYVHMLSGFQLKKSFLNPKSSLAKAMFLCFPSQQSISKVLFLSLMPTGGLCALLIAEFSALRNCLFSRWLINMFNLPVNSYSNNGSSHPALV